ncbi:HAD family hydrolase [Curtobacterium sp. VKM Ac-1393]|uniref:HAD family hydrolase n=1 Tax=Curtobacterium sp. VKM Ac-1393 TaxID=2783814 RepID=UPI00188BEF00|nr:HAD family hydrolase [Curtobacterium sp. VKM Ac-1393]MBF4606761.1 HAD family hydrolase [Curtobacterium sp. VKM Ac-1393]
MTPLPAGQGLPVHLGGGAAGWSTPCGSLLRTLGAWRSCWRSCSTSTGRCSTIVVPRPPAQDSSSSRSGSSSRRRPSVAGSPPRPNSSSAGAPGRSRCIGLLDAIDVVCTSERIGVQKPDGRAFRIVAAELGVAPDECLFVGDSVAHDVEAARAVGMRGLLVDHEATDGPDFDFARLVSATLAADTPFSG